MSPVVLAPTAPIPTLPGLALDPVVLVAHTHDPALEDHPALPAAPTTPDALPIDQPKNPIKDKVVAKFLKKHLAVVYPHIAVIAEDTPAATHEVDLHQGVWLLVAHRSLQGHRDPPDGLVHALDQEVDPQSDPTRLIQLLDRLVRGVAIRLLFRRGPRRLLGQGRIPVVSGMGSIVASNRNL